MADAGQISQLLQQAVDRGDADRVTRLAERRLRLSPHDGRVHEETGLAFHEINKPARAQELLELAQLMVPLNPEAELTLAECYIRRQKPDLAVGLLENVGQREQVATRTLLRTAARMNGLGNCRAAWLICRRAVRQSPDDGQAWFDLSVYMGRVGFPFSQIERVVQRAIDLEPDNVAFRISLAVALARQGRENHAYAVVRRFGVSELEQICCSSCLESLRTLFEQANDWRGVCLCNEQLVQRSISGTSDCCGESES